MCNRTIRYACAALVLLGTALLIHHLGGAPDGASVTFAQVLARIRAVRPYAYTLTTRYYHMEQGVVQRQMILNEYQRREEFPDGTIRIFDYSREPVGMLELHPARKQAVWETYPDQKALLINPGILETLRRFEGNPEIYQIEDRGVQEMDGHTTKCFQVPGERYVYTVWVDVVTRLPVRVELEHLTAKRTLVMTEFDFAPRFGESQFDRTPPEGYTLTEHVVTREGQAVGGFRPRAYTKTVQGEDGTTEVARFLEPSIDRCRREHARGLTEIYDFSQQPHRMLRLETEKKQATLETYADERPNRINVDFLEILKQAEAAPVLYNVEDRGIQVMEGHATRCLYVAGRQGEISATFWVDVDTGLPVRMEMKRDETLVYSEFEFDVQLDPNLFELKAPAGYTFTEVVYPAQVEQLGETHLLAGLRVLAEFLGGAFPRDLAWPTIQEQMRAYVLANDIEISGVQLRDLRTAIEPFNGFVGRLRGSPESFDLHYTGDGVYLGDARAVVLWYRPAGSANYHVVYGNLRVEEVSPESVPRK